MPLFGCSLDNRHHEIQLLDLEPPRYGNAAWKTCTYKRSLGLLRCRRVPLPFSIDGDGDDDDDDDGSTRGKRRGGGEEEGEKRTEKEKERKVVAGGRSRSAPATVSFQTIHGGRVIRVAWLPAVVTPPACAHRAASRRLAPQDEASPTMHVPLSRTWCAAFPFSPSSSRLPEPTILPLFLSRSVCFSSPWDQFREWKKEKLNGMKCNRAWRWKLFGKYAFR